MDRTQAVRILCSRIFGRNNLISSDFEDVDVWKVEREYTQTSSGGVLVQFSISLHALGKIMDEEAHDALVALMQDKGTPTWEDEEN